MEMPDPISQIVQGAFGVLLWVSITAHVISVLLIMTGVVLSPVAAAVARRSGGSGRRNARNSCLMLLPWLLIQKRVDANDITPQVGRFTYRFIFGLWLIGPALLWALMFALFVPLNLLWTGISVLVGSGVPILFEDQPPDVLGIAGSFALAALVALGAYFSWLSPSFSWRASLARFRAFREEQQGMGIHASRHQVEEEYLAPFRHLVGWTVASLIAFVIAWLLYLAALRPTF